MSTYHQLQKTYTVKIADKSGNPPSHEYPDVAPPPANRVSIIAGHTVAIRSLIDRVASAERVAVELARELVALIAGLEEKNIALANRVDILEGQEALR